MSRSSVVDANVILRWLLDDHPQFSPKARTFWAEVQAGRRDALIPDTVLAEVAFVLKSYYAVPKSVIVGHLSTISALRHVQFHHRAAVQEAVKLFKQNNISLVDALVVAYGTELDLEIMSFDAGLLKTSRKSH